MIEVLILRKGLQCQLPIALVQQPIQRPNELHSSPSTQYLRRLAIELLVLCFETDCQETAQYLCILALKKPVFITHELYKILTKRGGKVCDSLEEDDNLAGCPAGDI